MSLPSVKCEGSPLRKQSSYLEEGCVFAEEVSSTEIPKLGGGLSGGRRRARGVWTLVPRVLIGQWPQCQDGGREAGCMFSKISWCFSTYGMYTPFQAFKNQLHISICMNIAIGASDYILDFLA